MGMLRCSDYGFTCDFKTSGNMERIIDAFKIHMNDKHGIDYSKEAIRQVVIRKNQKKQNKI